MPEIASAPSTPAAQAAAARLAAMRPPAAPGGHAGDAGAPGAATTKSATAPPEADKAKRKISKKAILIALVVLAAGYVAKTKLLKTHYAAGQKVPLGAIVPLGTITTNLSDGHLAQVSLSLQLTAPASTKLVAGDQDMLTATAVSDLGAQTYNGLILPAGRAALRAQLLAGFRADLGTADGAPQVAAVYVTQFILQ